MKNLFFPLFFLVLSSLFAQQRVPTYALLFAAEDYEYMIDLSNPIQQAEEIADALTNSFGVTTEIVRNPTYELLESKLADYQRKFTEGHLEQEGQLLVFFIGHGVLYFDNGYFMPVDAKEDSPNTSAMPYFHLRNLINSFACKHILVAIDACYSVSFDKAWPSRSGGAFGPPGSETRDHTLDDFKEYRTRSFFTSDSEGFQTPDQSNFKIGFLSALKAEPTPIGYLTSYSLFSNYLWSIAPRPLSGNFGDHEVGGRFLFFHQDRPTTSIDPVLRNDQQDLADWDEGKDAPDTCAAMRDYVAKHPQGHFIDLANERLKDCDATDRMLAAWSIVSNENTVKSYQGFIRKYPESSFVEVAEFRIKKLKSIDEIEDKDKRKEFYATYSHSIRLEQISTAKKIRVDPTYLSKVTLPVKITNRGIITNRRPDPRVNNRVTVSRSTSTGAATLSGSLLDLTALSAPKLTLTGKQYGKIAVWVKVSASGIIIDAKGNPARSNIKDEKLLKIAVAKAKKWRFAKASSGKESMGYITFNMQPNK